MAKQSEVFLIKTSDRNAGIRSLLEQFDLNNYERKRVGMGLSRHKSTILFDSSLTFSKLVAFSGYPLATYI
nr:hypothetical protein [Candidatus Freyarchaeota archaeon]